MISNEVCWSIGYIIVHLGLIVLIGVFAAMAIFILILGADLLYKLITILIQKWRIHRKNCE